MSETKKRIFDESIRLICDSNFESVSMRDIAEAVGIKAASIYNHFASKQELLDYYYGHYSRHVYDSRLPMNEMKRIVEEEDLRTIVEALSAGNRVFDAEDECMLRLTKIIYERRICDRRAAEIYLAAFGNQQRYICEALDHGIQIGRIRSFPVQGYAYAFVSQYICLIVSRFLYQLNPVHPDIVPVTEEAILDWMCHSLPLVDPS